MAIRLVSREKIEKEKFEKAKKKLEAIQKEIIDCIKVAIGSLVDIDYLYEIRDFIEEIIVDWEDEEIELDEDFLNDDDE